MLLCRRVLLQNAPEMRAIGIDLGSKRIGLAISDSDGLIATPLTVVARQGNLELEHKAIWKVAAEWEAEIAVVGVPYGLDGSEGVAAKNHLNEAAKLTVSLNLEVATYDERLTTVSANRALEAQSVKGPKRRQVVDMVAAAVMLQSWLDAGMPRG